MLKRLADIIFATLALIVVSPVLLLAGIGILLSDPGPVLYLADRAGIRGKPIRIFKLRTMRVPPKGSQGLAITSANDSRIFFVGSVLRKTKVDELPQLINIIKGEMSLVGPRPEDLGIVQNSYLPWMWELLEVRPGLVSPGTLFGHAHEHELLDPDNPEGSYLERALPIKLAIDRVYIQHHSLAYDVKIVWCTLIQILMSFVSKTPKFFEEETCEAREWLNQQQPLKHPT